MKNKFILIALMSLTMHSISYALVTVGFPASCDYHTLEDAYNDADNLQGVDNLIRVVQNNLDTAYNETFTVSKSIKFHGGFESCPAANDIFTSPVGKTWWTPPVRFEDNMLVITNGDATAAFVFLNDFILSSGNAPNAFVGGAITVMGNTKLSLTDSEIVDSFTSWFGGGILISGDQAEVAIKDSRLTRNKATLKGGGIFCSNSALVKIRDESEVINNVSLRDGGGIYAEQDCRVEISSGSEDGLNYGINFNTAHRQGGGIYADSGAQIYLTGNINHPATISYNLAKIGGVDDINPEFVPGGGGVFLTGQGTFLAAQNGAFIHNTASHQGGAIVTLDRAFVTITKLNDGEPCSYNDGKCSYFKENVVTNPDGDAAVAYFSKTFSFITQTEIFNNYADLASVITLEGGSTLTMENNLIHDNYASTGGFNRSLFALTGFRDSTLILKHNTLVAFADSFFAFRDAGTHTLTIKNSIIAEDFFSPGITPIIIKEAATPDPLVTINCNFVNEVLSIDGNHQDTLVFDPQFVDSEGRNYQLDGSSGAIDFCADSNLAFHPIDITGKERGRDEESVEDVLGPFDLGAYEYQGNNDIIFKNGFE